MKQAYEAFSLLILKEPLKQHGFNIFLMSLEEAWESSILIWMAGQISILLRRMIGAIPSPSLRITIACFAICEGSGLQTFLF